MSLSSQSSETKPIAGVSSSFGILLILIAGAPVLAMSNGGVGPHLFMLLVALMMVGLPQAPREEVRRAFSIFQGIAFAAAFPLFWVLLQVLPLSIDGVEQPIWRDAAAALGEPLAGHITIDLGTSVRSLFGYVTLLCLCFATAVLSQNRDRAKTVLFALCAITSFTAIEFALFPNLASIRPSDVYSDPLVAFVALGSILNAVFVIRIVERHRTRRPRQDLRLYVAKLLAGTAGVSICVASLIFAAALNILFAVGFGFATVAVFISIHRLGLQRWTAVVVGIGVLTICLGVIAVRFESSPAINPVVRFAGVDLAKASATARMLSDATWFGSGVGSFPALSLVYRDIDGLPHSSALNTIVSGLLGWGILGFLFASICLVWLFVVLFRGAITRRRDAFYAVGAAACLVTGFSEAFCDASFTDPSVQMLLAIILGLGLAQTVSHQAK